MTALNIKLNSPFSARVTHKSQMWQNIWVQIKQENEFIRKFPYKIFFKAIWRHRMDLTLKTSARGCAIVFLLALCYNFPIHLILNGTKNHEIYSFIYHLWPCLFYSVYTKQDQMNLDLWPRCPNRKMYLEIRRADEWLLNVPHNHYW